MMKTLSTEELLRLDADEEFQRIVATDPELERLETLKYDETAEFLLLSGVLGFKLAIGKLEVFPLTAARWSLLWAIRSPYVTGGKIEETDRDVFCYILAHDTRNLNCMLHQLPGMASCYSIATGLAPDAVHAELGAIINNAFMPLKMLPKSGGGEVPRYDADWLTFITGRAARETNETITHCMFVMSLGAVCCHYVNYRKREDDKGHTIRRYPPEDAEAMQIRRMRELQLEYLEKLKDKTNADSNGNKAQT